jgi:hypothetical protein
MRPSVSPLNRDICLWLPSADRYSDKVEHGSFLTVIHNFRLKALYKTCR